MTPPDSPTKKRTAPGLLIFLAFVVGLLITITMVAAAQSQTNQPIGTPPNDSATNATAGSTYVTQTAPSSSLQTTLDTTAQQSCKSDQTGTYPDCMSAAPVIHCSGVVASNDAFYSCNDMTGRINCTGSIINSISSNTCNTQKGAPYTCINNTISSVINITCNGTAYIDNSATQ